MSKLSAMIGTFFDNLALRVLTRAGRRALVLLPEQAAIFWHDTMGATPILPSAITSPKDMIVAAIFIAATRLVNNMDGQKTFVAELIHVAQTLNLPQDALNALLGAVGTTLTEVEKQAETVAVKVADDLRPNFESLVKAASDAANAVLHAPTPPSSSPKA